MSLQAGDERSRGPFGFEMFCTPGATSFPHFSRRCRIVQQTSHPIRYGEGVFFWNQKSRLPVHHHFRDTRQGG